MTDPDPDPASDGAPAQAGAFDLRRVLALLFGIYGTVLTVMGATVTSQADLNRAGGVNVNLWAGIPMLLGATAFGAWAQLRPIRLPAGPPAPGAPPTPGPH
ncbi:hypothetical protein GCM10009665_05140 [Kitasatospora nipponensis]|uniref:Uncharacterized protein n=1 Tax=Kitasatospora nipponensis TaxID=258049 RepID=A0ABN1VRU8_9ACTN